MPRPAATQKTKTTVKKQCGTCGEIFTAAACTNCGEKINIFPINQDGMPIAAVADAVGSVDPTAPIRLVKSPDMLDLDQALDDAMAREFQETLRGASLDKVKAMKATKAAELLRAENELAATKAGFMPPPHVEEDHQPSQQMPGTFQQPSMNSAFILQSLGGWTQEARDQLFERLRTDQDFALNFSRMLNPQPMMPQMPGMMNPMMMPGMMPQQPVEQAPQLDPIGLVTAIIAAVKSIQGMGAGNNSNNDRQVDIMLDEIKEMRKETADLREKLIEAQNTQPGITQDSVRLIIADALARNSEAHANIQEGVKVIDDLKSLTDGMVELGIMQKVTHSDDKPSIEQQRLDHEIRMEDKRETRDHELNLEVERSRQAESDTKGALMHNLFAIAQERKEEAAAATENTKSGIPTIDDSVVEARRTAVIS